jgi:hypothetical protein
VNHPAVFSLDNFSDTQPSIDGRLVARLEVSGVVDLTATGRIESGAIEEYAVAAIDLRGGNHFGDLTFEFAEEGIAVIETFRHIRDPNAAVLMPTRLA